MSVGYGLLKSVIHQGPEALVSLSDKGITNDLFQGEERTVFSAIEQFYLSYGELPTLDTIEVSSGITVPWDNFPIEPLDYWIDQVKERSLLLQAGTILSQAQDAMGRRDLIRLRECIQNVYIQLEESQNDYSVQSIKEAAQEVIDLHNRVQQNPTEIPGIPFAFPYLNLVSGGMGGGDIISLIGRPSTCKSYVALDEARHAHNIGERVLFISMEMPISQCARRLSALRTGLNYNRLRFGRVSSFGIRRLEEDVAFMDSQESFQWLSGGIFGTIDRIYAQIKHYHPSIVYIDGAYLIRTSAKGGQRWERVLHVLEVLKQIALTENIPIYITFQFNKTAPGTLEGVAYCVSGDSIIMSDSGMHRIQDKVGESLQIFDGKEFVSAKVVRQPIQEEWKIRTEYGSIWKGGANHRFRVWRNGLEFEWVKCCDLKCGDSLILFGEFQKGENKNFNLPKLYRNRSFITQPAKMTVELAEILGLMIGDGSSISDTTWTIAFDLKDENTAKKIEAYFWELFKYQVELKRPGGVNKKKKVLYIRFFTKSLVSFFRFLGVRPVRSKDKCIPYSILESSSEMRGAFLRGLFDADGSISNPLTKRGACLRYSTISERLAQDVQFLLRTMGIDSLCFSRSGRKKMYYVVLYRSEYSTFLSKIGFLSDRKQNRLVQAVSLLGKAKKRKGSLNWRKHKSEMVKIDKVWATGNKTVMFDVSTNSRRHVYLCDGIVTHNSDGVAQLSSIAISLDTEGVEDSTLSLPVQYRTLKLLKGREGETGKIRIELDFNRMIFSQNTVLSGMTNDFELEDAEDNLGNERDNEPIAFI